MSDSRMVPWKSLNDFVKKVYIKAGLPEDDAAIVADSLVDADMRGVRSHGIERVGQYLARIDRGLIAVKGSVTVLKETASTLLVDAGNLMGPVGSIRALDLGLEKLRSGKSASCTICVRNSNHYGSAAFYSNYIAEHGYIGFTCTSGTPEMAAWGSYEKYVGTSPLSVSVPGRDGLINLDMATSVQAKGKLRILQARGERLPDGWCLDKFGNPTNDPNVALDGGSMVPVGGPKGYGLSLFHEILGGLLSGAPFGKDVPHFINDMTQPTRLGHFFYMLNIESMMPLELFKDKVEQMRRDIKELPLRDGFSEMFLPGEIEFRKKATAMEKGIEVDDVAYDRLRNLSEKYDVELTF